MRKVFLHQMIEVRFASSYQHIKVWTSQRPSGGRNFTTPRIAPSDFQAIHLFRGIRGPKLIDDNSSCSTGGRFTHDLGPLSRPMSWQNWNFHRFSRCLELCLFIEWDILWQNQHITSRMGGFPENHCSGCEGYGLLFISIQGTPSIMAKGENDDNLLAIGFYGYLRQNLPVPLTKPYPCTNLSVLYPSPCISAWSCKASPGVWLWSDLPPKTLNLVTSPTSLFTPKKNPRKKPCPDVLGAQRVPATWFASAWCPPTPWRGDSWRPACPRMPSCAYSAPWAKKSGRISRPVESPTADFWW